jgi:hypothetical protein
MELKKFKKFKKKTFLFKVDIMVDSVAIALPIIL